MNKKYGGAPLFPFRNSLFFPVVFLAYPAFKVAQFVRNTNPLHKRRGFS